MAITNTIRHLKRDEPDRGKIEKLFAKKSDQVLLSALANPEHSDAARDILQELADKRGLQSAETRGWARTEDTMYVAPFGRRPSFEEALAAPGRRRRIYRTLQLILLIGLVGGIFAFAQIDSTHHDWVQQGIDRGEVDPAVVTRLRDLGPTPSYGDIYQYLHDRDLFAEDLRRNHVQGTSKDEVFLATLNTFETGTQPGTLTGSLETFFALYNSEVEYLIAQDAEADLATVFDYFTMNPAFEPQGPRDPIWASLALVLIIGGFLLWHIGGIYSWLGPCRTLLLRPFQAKKLSKPLTRFSRKNLSFYGHTITLSDKYVKESRWAYVISWIPRSPTDIIIILLFFIPAIRQLQRWVRVSSPSSYRFLKNRLARRFTMNMFWQNSINKLLKVKCSDVWWKQVVDLLMYSCQVIVVDMSWVKKGTEWELDKIDRRDLERKTLFVASEEAADYAREVIAKFWPHDEAPPPLYVYNKSGKLLDNEAYHREVARIISKSHLWDGPGAKPETTRITK